MQKRLKIGIDIDGVLAEFGLRHADICRHMFGKPDAGVRPVDWNMSNYGLSKDQLDKVWEAIRTTENFWSTLKVTDGVDPFVMTRLNDNHTLFFITSRSSTKGKTVEKQTAGWLERMLWVENPTVLVTDNKGPLAAALELDYFVDDKPDNCEAVKLASPATMVYLRDRSYNEKFVAPRIRRVATFNDFAEIVQADAEAGAEPERQNRNQESLADKVPPCGADSRCPCDERRGGEVRAV